jgi:beta-lactamase class D
LGFKTHPIAVSLYFHIKHLENPPMTFRHIFSLILLSHFCAVKIAAQTPAQNNPIDSSALLVMEKAFSERQIDGCFILYQLEKDSAIVYNQARINEAFLPASTFKIPNSLIALETGAISGEDEVIPWDGIERQIPAWNQDQNMESAMKYSAVWFYQELARRIGPQRMQEYVTNMHYGNMKAGPVIDTFWLEGDIRITPQQQLEFLKKLINSDLPFKTETMDTVKKILIVDQNERYIFRAKTGWAARMQDIGWYVGYICIEEQTWIFVNNIDIQSDNDAAARKDIVKEIIDTLFNINLTL